MADLANRLEQEADEITCFASTAAEYRPNVTAKLLREAAKALRETPSETKTPEGYPGVAHDFETMRTALQRIAITDDADCRHVRDPETMKKIARDALRSVK